MCVFVSETDLGDFGFIVSNPASYSSSTIIAIIMQTTLLTPLDAAAATCSVTDTVGGIGGQFLSLGHEEFILRNASGDWEIHPVILGAFYDLGCFARIDLLAEPKIQLILSSRANAADVVCSVKELILKNAGQGPWQKVNLASITIAARKSKPRLEQHAPLCISKSSSVLQSLSDSSLLGEHKADDPPSPLRLPFRLSDLMQTAVSILGAHNPKFELFSYNLIQQDRVLQLMCTRAAPQQQQQQDSSVKSEFTGALQKCHAVISQAFSQDQAWSSFGLQLQLLEYKLDILEQ